MTTSSCKHPFKSFRAAQPHDSGGIDAISDFSPQANCAVFYRHLDASAVQGLNAKQDLRGILAY